jgi:hypothetical protein
MTGRKSGAHPIWATKPKVKIMGLSLTPKRNLRLKITPLRQARRSIQATKTTNSPMIARAIGLIPKLHSGRR